MKWRWVPPVLSPVAPSSLVLGLGAAAGIVRAQAVPTHDVLAATFGAKDVVLTDSGTSALVLALRATVPRGGVVAMPAYACIDLIAAAQFAGATVRLYDLVPDTMSPDLESVRSALAAGVNAIVLAPLYGYPVDVPGVATLAAEHGVPVIEDAAQGAGGTLQGTRVGAWGDLSILSFGRGKGTTGGSGGALLVHNQSFVEGARAARAQLRSPGRGWRDVIALAAQWALARPSLYALPASIPALKLGEMVYHPGHEPRAISAAAARILGYALAADPAEVSKRRARAEALLSACEGTAGFVPIQPVSGGSPGYLRLALLDVTGNAVPDARVGALRGYPITLAEHPETLSVLVHGGSVGSGARTLRDRLFTVPTHSRSSRGDVQRLIQWLGARARDTAHVRLHETA